jgi:hypothetical protein
VGQNTNGGLVASWSANITIANSTILGNSNTGESYGAGVFVGGNSTALITQGSVLEGNILNGFSGAGLAVAGYASATVSGRSAIRNNTVHNGSCGGVAVAHNAWLLVTEGSAIVENASPDGGGGGLCVDGTSVAAITDHSRVVHNRAKAGWGGGIVAYGNATLKLSGRSVVANNIGNGISLFHNSTAELVDSTVEGNVEAGPGSGMFVGGNASASVTEHSRIVNNFAKQDRGGGLAVAHNATVVVSGGSSIANNTAYNASGGGVAVLDNAQLAIEGGSEVFNNTCQGDAGGGVFMNNNSTLLVRGHSRLMNNTARALNVAAFIPDLLKARDRGSNLNSAVGGGIKAGGRSNLTITEGVVIANNTAQRGGGGIALTDSAYLLLTGGSRVEGNTCKGGSGGGISMNENSRASIASGVVFRTNVQQDGSFTDDPDILSTVAKFGFSVEKPGQDIAASNRAHLELDGSIMGDDGPLTMCSSTIDKSLEVCNAGMYKPSILVSCQCCQAATYSFDANISAHQCLSCPPFAKCPGGDVVLPVAGYWHSSNRSVQMHQCPLAAACGEGGVCKDGYDGNLCGSCAHGYGMTLPFRCGQCMAPERQLGLYVMALLLTIMFITLTVHLTWRDNSQGLTHVRASDLIKVLVQYLQYLMILSGTIAPWPQFLKSLFAACASVFGAASGQVLSMDCWLSYYGNAQQQPLSIQRLVVSLAAPIVLLFGVVLLQLLGRLSAAACRHSRCVRSHVMLGRMSCLVARHACCASCR